LQPWALGPAAITEETKQSQDEDHNQDDHQNAEDAPPLVANVYALVPTSNALKTQGELERMRRACSLYLVSPSCTSPRQARFPWTEPVMYSEEEIAALDKDARQRLAESDLSEVIHYVELGQALHFATSLSSSLRRW
jgi:hypothetical protein